MVAGEQGTLFGVSFVPGPKGMQGSVQSHNGPLHSAPGPATVTAAGSWGFWPQERMTLQLAAAVDLFCGIGTWTVALRHMGMPVLGAADKTPESD